MKKGRRYSVGLFYAGRHKTLLGSFDDQQLPLGRIPRMAQRFLIFGRIIAGLGRLDAVKTCDDVARAFFAFKLHKAPAAGNERAAMLGDCRPGQRGLASIGFFVSDAHMGNPECGHNLSFQ